MAFRRKTKWSSASSAAPRPRRASSPSRRSCGRSRTRATSRRRGSMRREIRQAAPADAPMVEEMLLEAARWVDALGVVMWEEGELGSARIAREVREGQFVIAFVDGVAAGAIRFQLVDRQFWPDLAGDDSAFVHRLVVRRAFKGL